jgi:hypothetical protein
MSRGPHNIRQTDVEKAIKAAIKAGATDWRVEIVDGKIMISAGGKPDDTASREPPPDDDLDRELAEFEARHGEG